MGALTPIGARRGAALGATLLACLGLYLASTRLARVIKINLTDSMPLGIYRVRHARIAPGVVVVACPPTAPARLGLRNGYLVRGLCASGAAPVLKYVAAVAGSRVRVTPDAVTIDGRTLPASAAHRQDRNGRAIPSAVGMYRLAQNEVWLYSPAPWSWDSRYFGPVAAADVLGVADPVMTLH